MSAVLSTEDVQQLIVGGETLRVEFKSERRGPLSDHHGYEAVVCLANGEGGVLLIGVENDGQVTGSRPRHGGSTDPYSLQAAIFNNTVPPINTRVSLHTVRELPVLAIEVDPYPQVCATKDGKCLRRAMGVNGPECQPFYPHEHPSRRGDLGLEDLSAQPVSGANWSDLDPLEVERLRQTIRRLHGENVLLTLEDREMVQALRLVESRGAELVPRVAGLLLLGREASLHRFIPTHSVAFQVLDAQGAIPVNDWFQGPLLRTLEAVEDRFSARNQENEVQVGLFRLPLPDYSPESFREAVNNAVLHRDYARQGTVHIQFHPDYLFISNPGGFLEGITQENLLVHEPKPRNPLLAEALRRIGLVETTGRGIDKIYIGQLRFGRPLPDYSRSDRDAVRLVLQGGDASLAFAAFVFQQDREQRPLSLDEMITLNRLQYERRVDTATLGKLIQKGEAHARSVLERLVERGLVEARGEKRGRVYHLSAWLYRQLGSPAGYVRVHGFDPIRQEAMVMQFVQAHGRITRGDAMGLCTITGRQASKLLRRLTDEGKLVIKGSPPRWVYYVLPAGR